MKKKPARVTVFSGTRQQNFACTGPLCTVRLTSIYNPQIEGKSHVTAAGLTNLFMVARTSLLSELVLATIKKSWHHWKLVKHLASIKRLD